MRQLAALACAACLGAPLPAGAQQLEALWYSTGSENSTQSFLVHADHISIVSPQVFAFDAKGNIHGHVDPRVVAIAHEKHVKLVPLVMNPGFDQQLMHKVLTTASARRRAIAAVAELCAKNHFDGIQYDIENVNVADKTALTTFMGATVPGLHHAGCTVSAAVVPRTSDDPGPTAFHKWIFENWRGVYDYTALADTLDFISYMTYAQHTGGTTPGPVAGYEWMEQALQFVLSQGVPPSKISLGIPQYSDWWYTKYDKKNGERGGGNDISYAKAMDLLAQHHAQTTWDETDRSPWAKWSNAGTNEFLWVENARTFAAKLELVRKYHLRGYSVWVLGLEDPNVWTAGRE